MGRSGGFIIFASVSDTLRSGDNGMSTGTGESDVNEDSSQPSAVFSLSLFLSLLFLPSPKSQV